MKNGFRRLVGRVTTEHGFLPLIVSFIFNNLVYGGTKLIAADWEHYNITGPMDQMIPFIPEFLSVYVSCYLFWTVNYILIARQDKKDCYRFFTGDFLSRLVCMAFFLLFPTTNTRPVLGDAGFWNQAIGRLYAIDSPVNLFPSIHCLVSWFCYIGIRGRKNIPLWYRSFSCIVAIAVFISTLVTKQHVLIDVVGGVALAEVSYWIGKHTSLYLYYGKVFDRLTDNLFPTGELMSSGKQKETTI